MLLIPRSLIKNLDKLFFEADIMREEIPELKACRQSDGANVSADPTGMESVATVAPIEWWRGYHYPEQWLQVVDNTWAQYGDTDIGRAMRERYTDGKSQVQITTEKYISDKTYFCWRETFLICALLEAAKLRVCIQDMIDKEYQNKSIRGWKTDNKWSPKRQEA